MNTILTGDLSLEQRIWRYMDLPKFVLMLSRQTLYFACLSELGDPYEGYQPRSDTRAVSEMVAKLMNPLLKLPQGLLANDSAEAIRVTELIAKAKEVVSYKQIRNRFGVSCWHGNDSESEAMWKTYSALGSGVAVTSTVSRLSDVLSPITGASIRSVRYADFDSAPPSMEGSAYYMSVKRKSFEYEREIRAILPLSDPGVGQEIPCDLRTLIANVYVSPNAHQTYVNAVKELCSGLLHGLELPVHSSVLYDPPDYDVNFDTV